MDESGSLLLAIFAAFASAKVAGEVMIRLGQPPVIGELAAGVLVGPSVLGWVPIEGSDGAVMLLLAELGVIVLLFEVGLETHPSELRAVGRQAAAVAVLGVALPFAAGYAVTVGAGREAIESAFVATALVATSVGVTGRVLADMGRLAARESRVILGAAVIDDVLGLLVLTVVAGLAADTLSGGQIVALVAEAIAFVVVLLLLGPPVVEKIGHLLAAPRIPRAPFALALTLLLGLSVAAEEIGLAAIVGAFLAGSVLSGTRDRFALEEPMRPVSDFLTPFFFVVTGAQIDVGSFAKGNVLALAAVITVVAIAGKLAGGILGARSLGMRSGVIVGVGMVPRGEVGIIVAGLALRAGVVTADVFGAVLAMVVVTTLAAPPALQVLWRRAG